VRLIFSLSFVVGEKIEDSDQRVNQKHANNPPGFGPVAYLFVESGVY
jgi:hypothetical protein